MPQPIEAVIPSCEGAMQNPTESCGPVHTLKCFRDSPVVAERGILDTDLFSIALEGAFALGRLPPRGRDLRGSPAYSPLFGLRIRPSGRRSQRHLILDVGNNPGGAPSHSAVGTPGGSVNTMSPDPLGREEALARNLPRLRLVSLLEEMFRYTSLGPPFQREKRSHRTYRWRLCSLAPNDRLRAPVEPVTKSSRANKRCFLLTSQRQSWRNPAAPVVY